MPTPEQVEQALAEAFMDQRCVHAGQEVQAVFCSSRTVQVLAQALRESKAELLKSQEAEEAERIKRIALENGTEYALMKSERDEQRARAEKAEDKALKFAAECHALRGQVERLRKVVDAAKIVVDPLRRVPRSLNEQALMSAIAALEEGHGL